MSATFFRNAAALGLLGIGLLQILGDLSGNRTLKGIGAATVVSPCPKVFSDINGLETFASSFDFRFETPSGGTSVVPITPVLYSRLGGPYNRRNAYGAALSYAPKLPVPLWHSVFQYGLGENGPLRRELNLPDNAKRIALLIRTKTRGRSDAWEMGPSCEE